MKAAVCEGDASATQGASTTATVDVRGNATGDSTAPARMDPSLVCTCVVDMGSRVCFATYDECRNEILVEECACDSLIFSFVTERYYSLVQPNLLLVGNSAIGNECLLEALTTTTRSRVGASGQDGTNHVASTTNYITTKSSIPYSVVATSNFDLRNCMALILKKLRVLSLVRRTHTSSIPHTELPQRSTTLSGQAGFSYHSLGTLINFDSHLQVKCIGALLSHLRNTIFSIEPGGTITVNNIVHTQSSRYMNINDGTFSALKIFSTEHHPLMAVKGRGNSKEGPSLFSLLDKTASRGGRQMLRSWMLKPLLDRGQILLRQDGIELFLNPNSNVESSLGSIIYLLKEIGPITQIIRRLQKYDTVPEDFVTLTRTLSAAIEICRILSDITVRLKALVLSLQSKNPPRVGQRHDRQEHAGGVFDGQLVECDRACRYITFVERILERCNIPSLTELDERISSIVDIQSTFNAKDTVCIRRGYDEELDNAKDQYACLHEHLCVVCDKIMSRHPQLGKLVVVFIPQVGFLTGIPTERVGAKKDRVFGASSGQQNLLLPLDFTFFVDNDDDGITYFKNKEMKKLDQIFGDPDAVIKDTESMIVSELEDDILDQEIDLRDTSLALSELDCIIAFAQVAKERNFVRPHILPASSQDGAAPGQQAENVIKIRNGRHPLQEVLVDREFIPNDTDIRLNKRVNIVTGPNFSGKSCYARQVGVLVYMAHIGSFLPCDSANISLFDQILAYFSSVGSCAVPQSSFQFDLTQMGNILRRSTPMSLVLIDEFGKGTSPASGIALLSSATKHFARTRVSSVLTTHFLEMFSRRLITDGKNGIKALRMAVHLPTERGDSAEPLFRLEDGVVDSSAGIMCAKKAGLSKSVVARAKDILELMEEGKRLEPCKDVEKAIAMRKFPQEAQDAAHAFLSIHNWAIASDDEVGALFQMVAQIP